jgi:hypothetical protein
MRISRGWSTFEYCWRFGVRPLMWLVRLAVFTWALAAISWVSGHISDTGVIAGTIIYGMWEIGRSIRAITPLHVNVARGEKLIVQRGATVSVPKQDIDRLLEAIARQEARA